MSRQVTVAGVALTLRPFTEAEAVAYADKELAAMRPQERLADYLDDGDDEVIACVTSPDKAAVLELLEEYPGASSQLAHHVWGISGIGMQIRERPVTDEEKAEHPEHKRLWGCAVTSAEGALVASLLLRKLSRMELKFMQQAPETKKRGRILYADLAKSSKAHTLSGADPALWEAWPGLSTALGALLLSLAQATVTAVEGK